MSEGGQVGEAARGRTFLNALSTFLASYALSRPCTVVTVLRPFLCWTPGGRHHVSVSERSVTRPAPARAKTAVGGEKREEAKRTDVNLAALERVIGRRSLARSRAAKVVRVRKRVCAGRDSRGDSVVS